MRRSTNRSVSEGTRLIAIHRDQQWSSEIVARSSPGRLHHKGRGYIVVCSLPAERTCYGHWSILRRLKGATPVETKGSDDEFGDKGRRWSLNQKKES